MIEFNPRKRITVADALAHEFLAPFRESMTKDVSREGDQNLYNTSTEGDLNMEIEKMPLLVSEDIKANVCPLIPLISEPHILPPQMKREILAFYEP
jgi:serine/threonine protein kinase